MSMNVKGMKKTPPLTLLEMQISQLKIVHK